ncbi:MAG: DNA gyrase subunit A [Candidatus Schekmanbacteria bacterium RIFCSPHIGHO2_02_FULL_38_11]|uniref:DNA gyrase subunit A n=1 Tax=Candidatus Schekmanbacteria bacterium RIFCSPLOWO2_12_FULL_38_15 TaxID=1817883 RepID=A0A1F7SL63_9BACT|nr:MAG: DNA gyrase subunit A [Candidatus Schekmanbacteria bacterium GWA2_38_9]OGL51204.1 MAG: DNA gyrase subunit A [Candidatus Schekmanbacteria bacterium RIFCSPHIGHO2_02_FULL_38_11]OGL51765.1 MAG: DNA gyrase subunit A [Candidatus Schekmanbacteria bacterium RIFCSPLOWO2_02_FULL_38_14]OGL53978.1 MAG: DNA gyrase subunit A [Candidatus Schekmanbacteria bacterium RIFCSPLOWO2_12_FULL_38_15]
MNPVQQNLIPVNIEDEMRDSYINYAMSVIIGRALPDVRDGLKPVHRRILYAMDELGLQWNKPFKKSARIVGEVLGKYHPHGDTAVYDAMIRMVQEFSLRYPLIYGQGNFGSVDGDSAAAMRYTEVRMAKIAQEMLLDIDKETVKFTPNFDESLNEPEILPARIPNLLINGSSGIAVGMATNIPPHNLTEIIDGAIIVLENPEASVDDLLQVIKGPDFPTAAYICGTSGIVEAYRTGRGKVMLKAKAVIEKPKKGGKDIIVITEIPYQVNKSKLLESIAELMRDKKIDGISDLRDESDRDGMRIVIELKRDEIPEIVLNQLYKHTQLHSTFGIIMLSMVNGEPQVLDIRKILYHFVEFRKEIVILRTRYNLRKAEERAHILEGLKTAVENIDEVVSIIKKSANPAEAKEKLMKRFPLSEIQAREILEMKLQRLTGLEREKLVAEYQELLKTISKYKAILVSEELVKNIVKDEFREIREKYGDERRTQIIEAEAEIDIEDLIKEEDMVVTISHSGYIKRNPTSLYRSQKRGGKGKIGMITKEEDFVETLFVASTHSYILFFTNKGKILWLKVHEIPQAGRATKGRAIVNILKLSSEEKVCSFVPVKEFSEDRYVIMATKNGVVKKTNLDAFSNPRSTGIIAISIDEDDELVSAGITDGNKDILLAMKDGNSIRFKEDNVRPTGRGARGVTGVSLEEKDEVVGMEVLSEGATILTVTENGYGKRTELDEYRCQGRGGKGIITIKTSDRNGKVVGVMQVHDNDDVMMITSDGKVIRTEVKGLRVIGRNTQGVRLIDMEISAKVVSIARIVEDENGD